MSKPRPKQSASKAPLIGPEPDTVTHGLLSLRRSLGIDRGVSDLALLHQHDKQKLKAAALRELAARQNREARAHRASAAAERAEAEAAAQAESDAEN
jgi:hypothetical protein